MELLDSNSVGGRRKGNIFLLGPAIYKPRFSMTIYPCSDYSVVLALDLVLHQGRLHPRQLGSAGHPVRLLALVALRTGENPSRENPLR